MFCTHNNHSTEFDADLIIPKIGKNLIGLFILILIRYAVILKCWKTDVDERLSFKDILEELCSLSNYI